jgi:hypothetical protein
MPILEPEVERYLRGGRRCAGCCLWDSRVAAEFVLLDGKKVQARRRQFQVAFMTLPYNGCYAWEAHRALGITQLR